MVSTRSQEHSKGLVGKMKPQESLGEHIPAEAVAGVKALRQAWASPVWNQEGAIVVSVRREVVPEKQGGTYILPHLPDVIKREACWRVLGRVGSTIFLFLWLDPLSRLSE